MKLGFHNRPYLNPLGLIPTITISPQLNPESIHKGCMGLIPKGRCSYTISNDPVQLNPINVQKYKNQIYLSDVSPKKNNPNMIFPSLSMNYI